MADTILKKQGIEGNYEGIGNLILGYAAKPAGQAAPRKADYSQRSGHKFSSSFHCAFGYNRDIIDVRLWSFAGTEV